VDFQDYQRAFTAHLRDPASQPRPAGVGAARLRLYRELVANNLDELLGRAFPVCRSLLGHRRWRALLDAFLREHACATPYFRAVPGELLDFLGSGTPSVAALPGWLGELAHYEWVELDLETRADEPATFDPNGDLIAGVPVFNPAHHLLAYRYPVQRLTRRYRPAAPPAVATFLLAFRAADDSLHFIALNAVTAKLLNLLQSHPDWSGAQAISALAAALPAQDHGHLARHAAELLTRLRDQGALLGTRPAPLTAATCRES